MATGGDGVTYGVGDAAEKMNVGPNVGAHSKMQADGSVVDKNGEVVFDPADDTVELKQDDPEIDYVDGVGAKVKDAD